jgi:hypothetical protein
MENKPIAWDISLCMNNICPNKCKRYKSNWTPEKYQSYSFPTIELDENGNLKKCDARMEEK